MLIDLRLMGDYGCVLLHINNMAKRTAGGGGFFGGIGERAGGREICLHAPACDISHQWGGGELRELNDAPQKYLNIDYSWRACSRGGTGVRPWNPFPSFPLRISLLLGASCVTAATMLFLEVRGEQHRKHSLSAADNVISRCKLFISLRSWGAIVT